MIAPTTRTLIRQPNRRQSSRWAEPHSPAADRQRRSAPAGQQTARLPDGNLLGVSIIATGSYAPETIVRNSDLTELGCDEQWIVKRTGITQRHHASPQQNTSDLAYEAARNCLEAAEVGPQEIDLIIVATATPDHLAPSTAALVQGKLGSTAAAMDLNAACAGFLYAINTAAQFVKTGACKYVLVIGAETISRNADPQDPKTYPLFGDGAGAVLLGLEDHQSHPPRSGILASQLGATGEMAHLITMPIGPSNGGASDSEGSPYLQMEGRKVFKWAVSKVPEVINQTLQSADLSVEDIDLFIFHQANRRIIEAAAEGLGADPDKVFVNVDRYGNTSAASIPLALDEAARQGRVKPGSRIVFCGFGAGLTWGVCVYQHGEPGQPSKSNTDQRAA